MRTRVVSCWVVAAAVSGLPSFGLPPLPPSLIDVSWAVRLTQGRLASSLNELDLKVVRIRVLVGSSLDARVPEGAVYRYAYGSGVILNPLGQIATANHLVSGRLTLPGRDSVSIMTSQEPRYLPVDVVGQDADSDLALLRANPRALSGPEFLPLRSAIPKIGARSYVLGLRAAAAPSSFEIGAIRGEFADPEKLFASPLSLKRGNGPWLAISQLTMPGYSGGAILDESGSLIGILLGGVEDKGVWSGLSYGIGVEALDRLLVRLNRGDREGI